VADDGEFILGGIEVEIYIKEKRKKFRIDEPLESGKMYHGEAMWTERCFFPH
jgi:hypothetical protein